ncbi:MAG: hypothetical protein KAG45_02520 [Methyloprofundus sp.]|nr:hypothetical protein [Methyloprofundus sp.]
MGVISRNRVKKKDHEIAVTEDAFLAKAEDYQVDINPDLKQLSLDELAVWYEEIDRQSHLLKGKILLEARTRFESDKEFGQWVKTTQTLCLGSTQKTRNRLMHLAEFFDVDGRNMEGISITAAYEISSPANKEIAEKIYKEAHENNLSVEEVKTLVLDNSEKQGDAKAKKEDYPDSNLCAEEKLAIKIVDKILKGETLGFKRDVLQKAIKYLDNQK